MTLEIIPDFKVEDIKKIKLIKFISKTDEDDIKKTFETFSKTQQNFEKKDGKKLKTVMAFFLI